MAQLQDINARREELLKSGAATNYMDAMAQARKEITASQPVAPTNVSPTNVPPTPVTPTQTTPTQTPQVVTPQPIQPSDPVTPTPTQPDNWMGDFSQIKKREVTQTVMPEPVTPVTPSTVTPEPVKTPAPVKPEVPVINRQQEIQNNLSQGYQTNPGLFTDRAAYDKAYNYASKSPEEQATLDSFYNSKQPTISSMYSAIVNKQEVPDSTKMTPAYKIAQNRYSKANMYSSMTPTQVSQEMKNAKLIEGSQAFEDLKAINPKLVQDATNLRKVNGDTTNIWTTGKDGTVVNNLENNIADDYIDNFGEFIKSMYKVYTPAEITAIIRTPDVVSAEDKAFSIEKSINELDKQIANIDSDIDTEQKGSGATGSRIAMEKASRRDVLNRDRDSLVREYTTYANRASNLINQNTVSFQTQQQQQQAQNNALMPFITDQYKTAQEKKQQEALLNDPATAIKGVMDEYKKLGIPFTSTVQSRLAEFQKSGLSLPDYLTKMGENIQQSPAYQNYARLQAGQLSDAQKMQMGQQYDLQKMQLGQQYDMSKMGIEQSFQMKLANAKNITSNKWTKLDDGLYTNESGQVITADELKMAKLTDNKYLSTGIGQEGGDCGFYASRATGAGSTPGGNSKEARVKAFSDKTPQVGGMVFFGGSGYDKTYGHVAVVTGVNVDGTINVKESNYNNNGKVTERTVPASSATGYYNNTPLAKGLNEGAENGISPEAKSYLDVYNKGTMDLETILTKLGTSKESTPLKNEIIKAISTQGGKQVRQADDPAVISLQNRINDLKFLKDNEFMSTVVGANTLGRTSFSNFYSGGKDEYLSKVKQFLSSDVLQTLIDAKAKGATFGALSDSELAQLKNSSNALAGRAIYDGDNIVGFKGSEKTFKEELQKLIDSTNKAIEKMTGQAVGSNSYTYNGQEITLNGGY